MPDSTWHSSTANVQTLKPYQEERSYSHNSVDPLLDKVETLETQFYEKGYDIVGVQEGRAKAEGISTGRRYRRYVAAAAPDGSLGVQLWIRLQLRCEVLHWRCVTPRILYATLRLANGAFIVVIVSHAPHSLAPEAVRGMFWDEMWSLTHMLRGKYAEASFRVAIDANGRVGSIASAYIGPEEPVAEDSGGSCLRAYADEFHLSAVNTYWPAGPTWCSTYGLWHRIDYVLSDAPAQVSRCSVDRDVDLTFNAYEDHHPVTLLEHIPAVPKAVQTQRTPAFRINKTRLSDSGACAAFEQEIWTFQRPASGGVDEWLTALTAHVRAAALKIFGRPGDSPRQPWISAGTWSILRLIAPARRRMHAARWAANPDRLRLWQVAAKRGRRKVAPGSSEWYLIGDAVDAAARCAASRKDCSAWLKWIRQLQRWAAPSLAEDRARFLDSLASKAQWAMEEGDFRAAYGVSRALGT